MKKGFKGFTLVELLIVIGLLGAIALIVLSAINPIEQSNRARDTKYKADAGQLISAIERYYATRSEYPWTTFSSATYPSADTAVVFDNAWKELYGVCGTSCTVDGNLILNNELKTEFKNRSMFNSSASLADRLRIGKATGSASSVYACYTPLSKSSRDKACADGTVYTVSGSTRTNVTGTANCGSGVAAWTSAVPASILTTCVPE